MYWRQRAKSHWLKGCDSNTKFFHASASSRKKINSIDSLMDDHGNSVTSQEGLCDLAANYFMNLFERSNSDVDYVINHLQRKLNEEDNALLLAPFSDDDFKYATLNVHPDKSPGPDGLNAAFYQHFWNICGANVITACRKWL